ncbi:glycosyltransferase [Lichenifustis flavocetrariae]|uniref:Glycosyltransferase n=1 Tax=Lichenifustis flavocetrariae TaxID=2949735 RepID=A0AA41YYS9_9HYPH|nr:glycosyltransferase [Lichenifustis flavocetrariae]MCW6511076.1 glycosyltransferase [Lichenifustis flavocetrariae]
MTSISVALATYNGERFLREQLESLARQSRLPDELVVADDGSTDRTLDIVREFATSAPFKTVLLGIEGRLGYRANFMRCAQHCSGDLIAFCDQDDVWDEDKLDVVSRCFVREDVNFVFHDYRLIDGNGETIAFPSPDYAAWVGGCGATC